MHFVIAVLPKGGPRKVPTVVSKSLICGSHNTGVGFQGDYELLVCMCMGLEFF